jgi:hypothetical protein
MKTGIELIAEERKRQIEKEGYSALHDSNHKPSESIRAAEAYIEAATINADGREDKVLLEYYKAEKGQNCWPWGMVTFKPTTAKRDLVKAGALIAAAIDRLQMETEKEK